MIIEPKNAIIVVLSMMAGALAFLFDFILEQVAIHFDYWTWDRGFIPLQNYIAWFIIVAAMASSYRHLGLRTENNLMAHYLVAQSAFFLFIRVSIVDH